MRVARGDGKGAERSFGCTGTDTLRCWSPNSFAASIVKWTATVARNKRDGIREMIADHDCLRRQRKELFPVVEL